MTTWNPEEREVTTSYEFGLRWLPVQASVKRTIVERQKKRSEDFIKDVERFASVSRQRIVEEVEDNETFADAYLNAGNQAAASASREFREALARLVSTGLKQDVAVDEVAYWVTITKQLEPIHLRFLLNLRMAELDKTRFSWRSINNQVISDRMGVSAGVGWAASRQLALLSLVFFMTDEPITEGSLCATTSAGRELLALCKAIENDALGGDVNPEVPSD